MSPPIRWHAPEEVDELSVLLDLNIEAKPEAQVTILTDPENNANLVGSTEGNIHLTLEDWERMTLTGNLTVVEGRYDFALGPLLRKQFSVDAGGTLFLEWGSVPRHGGLACQIRHPRQRPTAPGKRKLDGVQNEDIDVILHLNGPMLRPNIGLTSTRLARLRLWPKPLPRPWWTMPSVPDKPSPC